MKISEKLKTGLTNAEKIECYKKCIILLEKNIFSHICTCILFQYDDFTNPNLKNIIMGFYPEFLERKPKHKSLESTWFNSKEERIQVLNELIAELL